MNEVKNKFLKLFVCCRYFEGKPWIDARSVFDFLDSLDGLKLVPEDEKSDCASTISNINLIHGLKEQVEAAIKQLEDEVEGNSLALRLLERRLLDVEGIAKGTTYCHNISLDKLEKRVACLEHDTTTDATEIEKRVAALEDKVREILPELK